MIITFTLIAVLIIVILLFAASKPNTFSIKRAAFIQASPEKVFPFINDFHNWAVWSPWEKFDPTMQRTFSGPESGTGAIYEWHGNNKVGSGRMEITNSVPYSRIDIKLDFLKPFEAHNTTEFVLLANGEGVSITWTMTGSLNFVMKVMHVFMNMDKLVGKDFETGLNNLKTMMEGSKAKPVKPTIR